MKIYKTLKPIALLATTIFSSQVSATIDIGGILTPVGPHFEVASVYENIITGNGQTISGTGEITQINGTGNFCAAGGFACELTYTFGGFTSINFTGTSAQFTGGWLNFYVGTSAGGTNDYNPFASASSAADKTAAENGTLWLTLSGHATTEDIDPSAVINNVLATIFSTGTNFGTGTDAGTGVGLFDVDLTGSLNGNTAGAGAIANTFFNTDAIAANTGGPADIQGGFSFGNAVAPHPTECTGNPPTGPACLAGSADYRGLVAVPEPSVILLIGISLMSFGVTIRRNKLKL